jgi:hypothetical protein
MCRCLTTLEAQIILNKLDEGVARRHFFANIIINKFMDASYWWPTLFKDIHEFCKSCDNYYKIGGLKKKVWPN